MKYLKVKSHIGMKNDNLSLIHYFLLVGAIVGQHISLRSLSYNITFVQLTLPHLHLLPYLEIDAI